MNKGALVIALTFIFQKAQQYWGLAPVPQETVEMAADAIIGIVIALQAGILVYKRVAAAFKGRKVDETKIYTPSKVNNVNPESFQ